MVLGNKGMVSGSRVWAWWEAGMCSSGEGVQSLLGGGMAWGMGDVWWQHVWGKEQGFRHVSTVVGNACGAVCLVLGRHTLKQGR